MTFFTLSETIKLMQEIERTALEERSAKIAKKDGLTLEDREKVMLFMFLSKIKYINYENKNNNNSIII